MRPLQPTHTGHGPHPPLTAPIRQLTTQSSRTGWTMLVCHKQACAIQDCLEKHSVTSATHSSGTVLVSSDTLRSLVAIAPLAVRWC